MPTMNLTCTCGRSFTIDAALAGNRFVCPTCGSAIGIPTEAPPPVDPFQTTIGASEKAGRPSGGKSVRSGRSAPPWAWVGGIGAVIVLSIGAGPFGVREFHEHRLKKLNNEINTLPAQQREAAQQRQKQVREEQLLVTVTGPRSLQPGAPNRYHVLTSTLNNDAAPAQLTWTLKDKAGNELTKETIESRGNYEISVPVTASLQPNAELTLEVTARRSLGDKAVSVSETLPLEQSGYVTHLFTDKPMYQPGEVVSFRSLTLQHFTLQPPEEDLQLSYAIANPAGQIVFRHDGSAQLFDGGSSERGRILQGPDAKAIRGIGVGEFAIPVNAAGGEYVLSVSELRGRFAGEQRRFLVQRYQPPRLHKDLVFTRRSYGPGDEVLAACQVKRIEGDKPLADQPVRATVLLDGKRLTAEGVADDNAQLDLRTDADGRVALRFRLPKQIEYGEASLSVQFTDGGAVETIVRPIPIAVRRLRVDFYPEGGDLVVGVPNRVYFTARTTLGKPAELRGRILDRQGKPVAMLATFADEAQPAANQGMGRFEFTPLAGQAYELQIESPAGIPLRTPLPPVKDTGVVLQVDTGVTNDAEPLKAVVRSAGATRNLLIAACCRGRLVSSREVVVEAGKSESVALLPPAGLGGVFRVTVFVVDGKSLTPAAERLVYRQPSRRLQVNLAADRSSYVPGDKVRLHLAATDENKKPAAAIALLSVVDQAALSLADDRTLRQMPTHLLLTTEVRKSEDLENADFLVSDHASAKTAVDLLLGTQGWRRFAEQDPKQFRESQGADGERWIASAGFGPVRTTNRAEIERAAQPLLTEAARSADMEFASRLTKARTESREVSVAASAWRERSEQGLVVAVIGLFAVMFLTGVVAAVGAMSDAAKARDSRAWLPATVLLTSCLLLCGLGIVASPFLLHGARFGAMDSELAVRERFDETMTPAGSNGREAKTSAPRMDGPGLPPPLPTPPTGLPADVKKPIESEPTQLADADVAGTSYDSVPHPRPGESARRRFAEVQRRQAEQTASSQGRPAFSGERSFRVVQRDARNHADPDSLPPFVVREYAHQNEPRPGGVRSDFTEVVYWHPVLVLPGGDSTVHFHLSDSLTRFRALAFVHSTDGRLGAGQMEFAARLPFSIDAKVPQELTAGDVMHLPVAVANDTDRRRQVQVHVETSGLRRLDGEPDASLDVAAAQRGRAMFRFEPSIRSGDARLRLSGRSEFHRDQVERPIRIVPAGFPVVAAHSGAGGKLSANVLLPKEWTPGSLKLHAEVYPSVLADIQTGLDGMLREPYGCFEQTSSTSYPNLLILQYLQQTGQARPEVARRALELLERGYQRLVTFECPKPAGGREGFEWFGGPVPHEALTAYGLLQFHDLAKVYDQVDAAMLDRTRKFLLSKRGGDGTFTRRQDYHRFGQVSPAVYNAYLVWALTECETDADLNKEVQWLVDQAPNHADPYFLALTANSLLSRGDKANGGKILDKLVAMQTEQGSLPGRESIVGSYDRDLHIEATALAILAWLKAPQPQQYRGPLTKAVGWLTRQRGGHGGFGSTQATILALKAMVQLAKDAKKLVPGDAILSVRGQPILRRSFSASTQDALVFDLPEAEKLLQAGDNEVRIELTGAANELPMKISWEYHTLQPPSVADCPVKLTTRLDKSEVKEGDTVRLTAVVENPGAAGRGMAIAIIGLPAGLTLPEDLNQLKELAKPRTPLAGRDTPESGTIDYFELRGRELVLYWRGLDAGQKIELSIDLVCRVPGTYQGPASRAYLYYGADKKCWTAPLAVKIEPR